MLTLTFIVAFILGLLVMRSLVETEETIFWIAVVLTGILLGCIAFDDFSRLPSNPQTVEVQKDKP